MATLGLGQPDIPRLSKPDSWLMSVANVVLIFVVIALLLVLAPFMYLDGKLRRK